MKGIQNNSLNTINNHKNGITNATHTIYSVQCASYKRALALIDELTNIGFDYTKQLPKEYHHVLVDIQSMKVAGLQIPVLKYRDNKICVFEDEFRTLLESLFIDENIKPENGTTAS